MTEKVCQRIFGINYFFPMISGSAQGTGLGLSIAQSLANRHHGVIEFNLKPGKTCFKLLLPIDASLNKVEKHLRIIF